MRSLGLTLWVEDEALLDTVTALSGSGPAYFFRVMEALQKGGEALGLSSSQAKLLTVQTALGAARMALESEQSLATLRDNVTSPGGTTAAALAVLEAAKPDDLFQAVLDAAKRRAQELGDS